MKAKALADSLAQEFEMNKSVAREIIDSISNHAAKEGVEFVFRGLCRIKTYVKLGKTKHGKTKPTRTIVKVVPRRRLRRRRGEEAAAEEEAAAAAAAAAEPKAEPKAAEEEAAAAEPKAAAAAEAEAAAAEEEAAAAPKRRRWRRLAFHGR